MDCSPPGSSIHGILQARILEWVAFPSPGDLPDPGIEPRSPALQGDALPSEPPGKFIKGEAAKSMAGKGEPQLALASGGRPLARLRKQGSWNASGGASRAGEEAGGASLLPALLHQGAAWLLRTACWAFLENTPAPVQTSALEIGRSPETRGSPGVTGQEQSSGLLMPAALTVCWRVSGQRSCRGGCGETCSPFSCTVVWDGGTSLPLARGFLSLVHQDP